MVPSVPLLPLCSSHLCCNDKSTTGQFRTQIHTLATSLTMESFAIPCCKQPCLSPRETAPKPHPSIQVVTVWSFYSKKKDSCSFQCHVWKIPKISGYQSAIGQSQQLCANFATSSLVKNSHTPSLANMKWPEPSSSSCAAKKKASNFHSSNRWRIDPIMAFSSLKISGSAMTP